MSEGLYPPESRSTSAHLAQQQRFWSGEPTQTREIPDGPASVKIRATINLSLLERHIAAVKAGGTGEGVALSGALADVERKAQP